MSIREQPQAESSSDPLPARCPRCHYDLRGIVDAWADACPLAGCCSECGLNLLWRDVLNPVFTLPRWFVESDQGLRWWGHRLIATAICTLNPWRFWRRIQMSHPSRPGRLAMFLLTLVGLVYLLGTMSIGWQSACVANELNRANGTSINPTGAFIHGAGTPWSNRLIGAQALPNVTRGRLYSIPPINLTRQLWTQVAPAALCAFGFASVLAVMLVLLPQSRRRAKVRLMHIVRIYIYGLTPMVIPTVVVLASAAAFSRTWTNVGIGLFVLAIPLNFVWWCLAISRYLHMQHVPAIAASIGIIGLLIVLIISLGFEGLVW